MVVHFTSESFGLCQVLFVSTIDVGGRNRVATAIFTLITVFLILMRGAARCAANCHPALWLCDSRTVARSKGAASRSGGEATVGAWQGSVGFYRAFHDLPCICRRRTSVAIAKAVHRRACSPGAAQRVHWATKCRPALRKKQTVTIRLGSFKRRSREDAPGSTLCALGGWIGPRCARSREIVRTGFWVIAPAHDHRVWTTRMRRRCSRFQQGAALGFCPLIAVLVARALDEGLRVATEASGLRVQVIQAQSEFPFSLI